ncbi:MAG: YqaA family protein [Cellvibrio sp.]
MVLVSLLGLFVVAFVAATLLPAQSELVLAGMIASEAAPVVWLVLVATLGNVLGSCVNWALGRYLESFRSRRWFPFNDEQINKAQTFYHRYGRWSLLLSWVPIIGDPLTLIAGVMREKLTAFIVLVTVAKFVRYCGVALVVLGFI